jgi:DNA mismatch endonuclease (patch repair protein)
MKPRPVIVADVMTRAQRSRCMAQIRGRNTTPELRLRSALWKTGLRYRVHIGLPGKPDIAFMRSKLVVFVDGCFWHGCPLHAVQPKTNSRFWANKIKRNKHRDLVVQDQLRSLGWRTIRVWEHDLSEHLPRVVARIWRTQSKLIHRSIGTSR